MRKTLMIAFSAGLVGLASWAASAQEPRRGVAQKIGESVDNAGKNVKQGLKEAQETVRERFVRARSRVHDMEIESRVYSRIHWDKSLTSSTIELETRDDGVVTLRGTVPNALAKKKATDLAVDTVGVVRVIDALAVTPPATIQE